MLGTETIVKSLKTITDKASIREDREKIIIQVKIGNNVLNITKPKLKEDVEKIN